MATRTRHEYLKDLATNYVTNTTLETGAKGKGKLLIKSVLSCHYDISYVHRIGRRRRQRGRVVKAPYLRSSGPGFKSRSDRKLKLFLGSPEFNFSAACLNSQLVASCQLGFLTLLCCI